MKQFILISVLSILCYAGWAQEIEETEVENEKYANACKTKSEELQRSASLVIPNEPYHK